MLTREQLLGLASIIREETAQGLNTAQRVGHLLYEIASSFLIKTQDDHTGNKLSADELEAVERLIVVGTQLVGQNNTALENIVSTIHGSQLIEGNQTIDGSTIHNGGAFFGSQFVSGLFGKGGFIGPDGSAEFKSLVLREFLEAPELRLNRTTSVAGKLIQSWCNGIIESVTPLTASTGYFKLKLEDGEAGSCAVGDICMGIFHYGLGDATVDSDDLRGNVTMQGFTTTYFRIDRCRGTKNSIVYYTLRPHIDHETKQVTGYYPHPRPFMKFAGYGNFTNKNRQTAIIISHSYIRMVRLVDNWEFDFRNIALQIGELDGLYEAYKSEGCPVMTGYSAYLNNIYFTGKIEQLSDDAIDSIRDKLKNYNIYISEHIDMITVDDVGNVIGGLWKEEQTTDPDTGEPKVLRTYRIHSAITVRNGNNILTIAADGQPAAAGKYQLYPQPHGCSCFIKDSTLYITAIENIKDGVAGSSDDADFDYDKMRDTENCSVDILVDCEGVGTITKQFPITIKHSSQPYVGADLINENSAVSWNTKLQKYIGLPVVFGMRMWHNNEELDVESFSVDSIQGATMDKRIVTDEDTGAKVLQVKITALPKDLERVTNLNVTTVAKYSGINYERTLVHTLTKSTDTNVYSLVPSVDAVTVNKNNTVAKHISTNKVTCDVVCDSTDDQHFTLNTDDYAVHKLVIYYRTVDLNGSPTVWKPYDAANGVTVNEGMSDVHFILYGLNSGGTPDTSVVHDRESVPVIAAGVDGEGVEFVFFLQESWNEDSDDPNALPTPTLYDDSSSSSFQQPDYCPYTDQYHTDSWTDEPSGVGTNMRYEFYAERKKKNGVWQPFGEVHLWNKYAADGTSPYLIDLTNENSVVACDENGDYTETLETTKILLLHGSQDVCDWFDIVVTPTNVSVTKYSGNGYDSDYVIHPHTLTANSAQIVVTATLKTNNSIRLVAVYKLKKNLAGKNSVIYSLIPSLNVIHKNNTGAFVDASLGVTVKKTSGTTATILETYGSIAAEGLTIDYQNSAGTTTLVGSGASSDSAVSVSSSVFVGGTSGTYGVLRLKQSGTIIDTERINVVTDGSKGDAGVVYYLTSDINSIVKDYAGNFKGSARPTITAWKKVGENDAVRLADLVDGSGVVAEGMTINAYEMDGNTKAYTNSSDRGILTCATPYDYVDRFEAELVKGTRVYATLSIPILQEVKGNDGLSGCHERVFEVFTPGQTYYNEENTQKSGVRYLDFLAIEDSNASSGYKVYMCKTTHVAASSFNNDSSYWGEVSINAASAFFTYLIAKNANIKILTSAQFTIGDSDGNIVAGLANTEVPLWVGGSTPSSAPFRVTRAGILYATSADISGKITATDGTIGGFTIDSNRLYNSNWNAGIDISQDGKIVKIGKNAQGESFAEDAIIRAENTKVLGGAYNTALYLNASGATYNYAFYGNGNGVLNGLMFGYKVQEHTITPGSSDTFSRLYIVYGSTIILKGSHSDGIVSLAAPQLSEVRKCLGINSSTIPFAIEFTVVSHANYEFVNIVFKSAITQTQSDEYPYLMNTDSGYDGSRAIQIAQGDVVKILLVYDNVGTTSSPIYEYRAYDLIRRV